ncbi:ROK family protein [Pseudoroseicyclus sp. CXY001]|uniref:ROK family protein n=1 Tax=Pseudoroseicyclus sp. CXY001 TaxID=3242492 RepID=UPI00358DBDE0
MATQDQETIASRAARARVPDAATISMVDLLNLLRTGQATTRQELERAGPFSRSIVADRLALLTELGLVDESASGVANGGRAPRLTRFVAQRARLLVASISQGALGVGLVDLSGQLQTEHHEVIEPGLEPVDLADRVLGVIRRFHSRHSSGPELWGISIAVPGPVTLDDAPFAQRTPDVLPGWQEADLVGRLIDAFGVPVWVRSSIDAMTMGEWRAGLGQGAGGMLFVNVGGRVNAGLVIGGQLYRGASGAVGLIGQTGIAGGTGGGTLDSGAGAAAIRDAGLRAIEEGRSPALADLVARVSKLSVNDICQAAQMGDAGSVEIVSRAARLVGGTLATLTSMLDPQLIVLSGTIAQSNDIFLAVVREAVYGGSHPLVTRDLQIHRSQLSGSAALIGAGWIGTEELFRPAVARDWLPAGTPLAHPSFAAIRGARQDGAGRDPAQTTQGVKTA